MRVKKWEWLRWTRHKAVYAGALVVQQIFRLLPYRVAMWLAEWFAAVARIVCVRTRRRILDNLDLAYSKQRNRYEKKLIAREVFRTCARNMVEFCRMPRW